MVCMITHFYIEITGDLLDMDKSIYNHYLGIPVSMMYMTAEN